MTEQTPVQSAKVIPARHFCMSPYHKGPRWLLSIYFYRNNRHRTGLQSYCTTCTKIQMRPENQSARVKAYRRKYIREYKERKRRENNVPRRNLVDAKFRGPQLYAYLMRFLELREGRNYLNGISLDDNDRRRISAFQETDRVKLRTADRFATRYQLPLWEMIEVAGCYRKDKRSSPFK